MWNAQALHYYNGHNGEKKLFYIELLSNSKQEILTSVIMLLSIMPLKSWVFTWLSDPTTHIGPSTRLFGQWWASSLCHFLELGLGVAVIFSVSEKGKEVLPFYSPSGTSSSSSWTALSVYWEQQNTEECISIIENWNSR